MLIANIGEQTIFEACRRRRLMAARTHPSGFGGEAEKRVGGLLL